VEINVEKVSLETKEDEFLANMCQGGRITIPLAYRESLDLKQGTRIRVKIQKDED